MFADTAKITVKAGNGGNGLVSFHREKYVPDGGPDGGDGGRGGNIVFKADKTLSTLIDFAHRKTFSAKNGEDGKARHSFGRKGEDLYITVPVGTVIKDAKSGKVMKDMSEDGEEFIAAYGGNGGWGNVHFASATRQTPKFAKNGAPGEEWEVSLELKLIADVGLLGFPNVGKSSLISVVSQAKPIVGDYHFTTIIPVLGVVSMGPEKSFVMADIPGLIEGAAEGIGLGHEFLRHVERCRMLVHIVDVAGSEGRNPIEDFEAINAELEKFNPELAKCPQIVAGNKIDLATDEQLEEFKKYIEDKGYEYFEIVAPIKHNTQELINAVARKLDTLPPVKRYETEEIPMEVIAKKSNDGFTVTVEDGVYIVEAEWIYRILCKTDLDDYESLQYFQRVIQERGVIKALIDKGIQEGDTVSIYDLEFDYVP